ncbi:MAG: molybdopterin-dependent oxidoreductase, partial [Anaerolineae bacterium]|nr:molybdopterin-dependent oxidoreductase [Anaerolineae bacterium]
VVAEVRMDHAARDLRTTEIWCAQDCGLVINPDQVENQVMGNIVWGCSMALKERITFKAGAVEERNFDAYEILRHHEAPEVTVALVSPPNTAPVGVGESAIAPVAAAIANAVFAATGHRIRRLPMSYNSVFADANKG